MKFFYCYDILVMKNIPLSILQKNESNKSNIAIGLYIHTLYLYIFHADILHLFSNIVTCAPISIVGGYRKDIWVSATELLDPMPLPGTSYDFNNTNLSLNHLLLKHGEQYFIGLINIHILHTD